MTASPYGFRAMPIPNADPDEARRLLLQRGFDPSQMPAFQPAQGAGPAVAEDEASVQRLEQQQAAAAPPARAGIAGLFDAAPMGAPQQFAGSAGVRLPSDAVEAPLPPARPSKFGFGGDALDPTVTRPITPPPMVPPQADLPAPGARPIAAPPYGAPSAAPTPPATGTSPEPAARPSAPASAGSEGPGFLDKLATGIRANSGLLTDLGMGLMSTPGWGQGIAVGLKANRENEQKRAVTDLAKAEYGLKLRKIAKEEGGENATVSALVRKGYSQQDATDLVLAAAGGNREGLQNALNNAFRKDPEVGSGYQYDRTTQQASFIPGGSQDPAVQEREAAAKARGTDAGKPDKTKWVQAHGPDGSTVLYDEADPSRNQMLIPGQPVRPATEEELQRFNIAPGQAVKMTAKDGPVPIGTLPRPQAQTFERADGTKETRVLNPRTGQWDAPAFGGAPQASGAQTVTNPFATGKFNEGQGKAAGFSDRMLGSEKILRELDDTNSGFWGGLGGAASDYTPNTFKSADRQRFEQAKRDFVNAQLRRESGAAISQKEFDNAAAQYFPQPGDSAQVIQQKQANRQSAISAMAREGGPSYRPPGVFDAEGEIVPNRPPPTKAAPSQSQYEAEARRRGLIP